MMPSDLDDWYVDDARPLGWIVRRQRNSGGPRPEDTPVALFHSPGDARRAVAAVNGQPGPVLDGEIDVALIRRRMRELGLDSARAVASRSDPPVSHTTVSQILKGDVTNPRSSVRRGIAIALGLAPDALYLGRQP